jgi:hypothetical protein
LNEISDPVLSNVEKRCSSVGSVMIETRIERSKGPACASTSFKVARSLATAHGCVAWRLGDAGPEGCLGGDAAVVDVMIDRDYRNRTRRLASAGPFQP